MHSPRRAIRDCNSRSSARKESWARTSITVGRSGNGRIDAGSPFRGPSDAAPLRAVQRTDALASNRPTTIPRLLLCGPAHFEELGKRMGAATSNSPLHSTVNLPIFAIALLAGCSEHLAQQEATRRETPIE